MRYLCLSCDHKFEIADAANAKIRCPKCMRVTGIEALPEAGAKSISAAHQKWLVPALVLGALALVSGYVVWRKNTPAAVGETVRTSPLETAQLLGHLERLGVQDRTLASAFCEVQSTVQPEGADAVAKARDALQKFRAFSSARGFVRWSLGVPRETAPQNGCTVFSWVSAANAAKRIYPLEAALALASWLRGAGVDARIAEVFAFPGDRSPPDPSGHFGYFGVTVRNQEDASAFDAFLDPWGGHSSTPEANDVRELTDVEAVGAWMNLKAIHLLVRETDLERAMETSSLAVRLNPRSPATRSVRGAILLASGGANEGLQEFESALQLRADPPRRNLLAGVFLAQGRGDEANREIGQALSDAPDYAAGHATLAALHLTSGNNDEALLELQTAERLDSDLHVLPGLWANYYATIGDSARALVYAQQSVLRNPSDVQTRFTAARIYRQVSRYDDMRREAREILARTPEARRGEMEQLIRRMLGALALEDPEESEVAEEASGETVEAPSTAGDFQLGSELLGTGNGNAGGPSLLGGSLSAGEGQATPPPQLGGGLRLGGGSNRGPRLRLND